MNVALNLVTSNSARTIAIPLFARSSWNSSRRNNSNRSLKRLQLRMNRLNLKRLRLNLKRLQLRMNKLNLKSKKTKRRRTNLLRTNSLTK